MEEEELTKRERYLIRIGLIFGAVLGFLMGIIVTIPFCI